MGKVVTFGPDINQDAVRQMGAPWANVRAQQIKSDAAASTRREGIQSEERMHGAGLKSEERIQGQKTGLGEQRLAQESELQRGQWDFEKERTVAEQRFKTSMAEMGDELKRHEISRREKLGNRAFDVYEGGLNKYYELQKTDQIARHKFNNMQVLSGIYKAIVMAKSADRGSERLREMVGDNNGKGSPKRVARERATEIRQRVWKQVRSSNADAAGEAVFEQFDPKAIERRLTDEGGSTALVLDTINGRSDVSKVTDSDLQEFAAALDGWRERLKENNPGGGTQAGENARLIELHLSKLEDGLIEKMKKAGISDKRWDAVKSTMQGYDVNSFLDAAHDVSGGDPDEFLKVLTTAFQGMLRSTQGHMKDNDMAFPAMLRENITEKPITPTIDGEDDIEAAYKKWAEGLGATEESVDENPALESPFGTKGHGWGPAGI